MKDTVLTQMADEIVELHLNVVDELLEEMVEPLEDIGDPEKLIGKPYKNWSPEDLQRLTTIYGSAPDSPLQKFIFNREYKYLQELEQGV